MGVYVYSMQKPAKNVELGHTGEGYEIAQLKLLMSSVSDVYESRATKLRVESCEKRFPVLPKYVVSGKWEDGATVYRWVGDKPWAYDTPSLPYYAVGKLNLPLLRIERFPDANMAMKWVEGGQRFSMSKSAVERFNPLVINDSFVSDEFKKGVTYHTSNDVFVMDEMGGFSGFEEGVMKYYRTNLLPCYFGECNVSAVMVDCDMTNEFEFKFS